MPFDEDRLDQARGYLGDYLGDEEWFGGESRDWFLALDAYVQALPLDDPRIVEAAEYLQPFLDDDDRIDGLMYPVGAAVHHIEDSGWGGDHDRYLTGFVAALGEDWRRWQQMVTEKGDAAEWRMPDEDE
jgi:hypothetical protein